jgi:4-amino-4-deoxy-L-arabinose transferase-like glycosyltransferase
MQKRISGKINTIIEFFSANKLFVALFILLLALSAVTCFYALGRLPVNSWDEARHGVNAYEMMRTGNYISNTYNYVTDYWNLKPPMSFWAIILGFKLFGTGVMGLRFYSAVSMLLIILICAIFIYKQSGRLACIITTGLLATYPIFYVFHFARAGDSDALFALFLTTGTLSLYYLNKNIRFLYVNGICFALAFLLKAGTRSSYPRYVFFTCSSAGIISGLR